MQPVIVNIINEVVTKVGLAKLAALQSLNRGMTGVRYDYGHPVDIATTLAQLSTTEENRYKKYPLIGLFLDIPQKRGNSKSSFSARLNGFIAVDTDPAYTPIQRTQLSFVPVLHPVYDEFIKQLLKHPAIAAPENRIIPHTYVERYQWGKGGLEYYDNGKKNPFNDTIDAIEFIDMELEFLINC
jgi:hypothetical protein